MQSSRTFYLSKLAISLSVPNVRSLLFFALLFTTPLLAIPPGTKQAVVAIPETWNSSHASLFLYEKQGSQWIKISGPLKSRLGRTGSAWGKGIYHPPTGATRKREGDMKSPAGLFYIGGAWGYAQSIKKHPRLPYRKVTSRDLWVEDSSSANYNRHLILKHEPKTQWERAQQMKQGDYAHSLKLFIAHNPPPKPTPGAGSAVFFHIWRGGGSKPTAGCTTMPESTLKQLVAWIDPDKQPVYILLPKAEYQAYRKAWKLP